MDLEGNEEADKQAKLGAESNLTQESEPTAAGIRSIGKKLLRLTVLDTWAKAQTRLSRYYKKYGGNFVLSYKCPPPLKIARATLGRYSLRFLAKPLQNAKISPISLNADKNYNF